MSSHFILNLPLPLTFLKKDETNLNQVSVLQCEAYEGRIDWILKAKTYPGFAKADELFPFNVLLSASPEDVSAALGFNLHASFTMLSKVNDGMANKLIIEMKGDFKNMLNHARCMDRRSVIVDLDLTFDFEGITMMTNKDNLDPIKNLYHVVATANVMEPYYDARSSEFTAEVIVSDDFTRKVLDSVGKAIPTNITMEVKGSRFSTPPSLQPASLVTIQVQDDVRTRTVYQRLFKEKVFCDFVLVAENDFEIPCHKAILQVSSPFFERMFQTDFKEMQDNKCKLGLSEEGLKALLEYLYFSGIEKPLGNSGVAMQLLEISHELEIPELEKKMMELVSLKSENWLDFDSALKLFLRCTNLDLKGYDELKKKAVKVIKKKRKELKQTPLFVELMETNSKFAMEFLSYFLEENLQLH